ncbi:pleiotropic regulator 1-like [Sycon ciliatum]|uniref:pleiotropic regulator 1-like n=1 Tax=Sycon ciliatum TaxID=27933 RepID=UPI0020ABAD89|eukprot:scpid68759/ scgid8146/ Pleiotropic regulator 1
MDVAKHSVHTLVFRSLKRSHDMFLGDEGTLPPEDAEAKKMRQGIKLSSEYWSVKDLARPKEAVQAVGSTTASKSKVVDERADPSQAVLEYKPGGAVALKPGSNAKGALVPRKAPEVPKPKWHPPWKLMRVISGHLGWVRCIAIDPSNEWFATGSVDRLIKIWELGSGKLKLSLTGHISAIRGIAISDRHPYLFSCGEDKTVKCWDLEQNKVIRHYHGHLSAVYGVTLHPSLDVVVTCGRDSTARVWDMRTKACIHTLAGHTDTVSSVACRAMDPQVVTASHDSTVRLWDLAAGRTLTHLTNHKKSVRALALNPTENSFVTSSPDNIKQWKFPSGNFLQNLSGHHAIVNALAVNADGVMVSGADNGTMHFWDYRTGHNFQRMQAVAQPGSLDSEAGIYACTFDRSGSRLLTCEADKTIKVYKEDETATEESHPVNWRPDILKRKRF